LVLVGTGSAFSAGVDLFRILDGGDDYVARFIPALSGAFDDLFAYRRPVVAAVNGHAIAGGCVIAACADYRLMAEGRGRIGVPEQLVGVAFPAIALAAPRSPFAPWDRRELPGLFPVEEAARRVGHYAWIEMRLFEALGGWVATVPELDVKTTLGRHCYHHAWHAELWHKRLPELREMR